MNLNYNYRGKSKCEFDNTCMELNLRYKSTDNEIRTYVSVSKRPRRSGQLRIYHVSVRGTHLVLPVLQSSFGH